MPAVRCWPWGVFSSWLASRDLGAARSSYLAWVGPVPRLTGSVGCWAVPYTPSSPVSMDAICRVFHVRHHYVRKFWFRRGQYNVLKCICWSLGSDFVLDFKIFRMLALRLKETCSCHACARNLNKFRLATHYWGSFHHLTLNHTRATFFNTNMNMYLQFLSFLHIDMTQEVKSFPVEEKDLSILHSPYHGCWWLDDAGSQGVSNHDNDLVKPW